MPNYENGQIYMIWSPHTDKVYIGSTTQPLHKRFHDHKHNHRSSTTAQEIIDCDDARIELIEDYPCANKGELNKREGQLIRERASDCVNKIVAGRTRAEYRQDNREAIAEDKKAYQQRPEVKVRTAERLKAYRQIPEVKAHNAERQKAHRERPEVKVHNAERQKAHRERPEVKVHNAERKKAYEQRPEVKERRNELARQRRQRKKEEQERAA